MREKGATPVLNLVRIIATVNGEAFVIDELRLGDLVGFERRFGVSAQLLDVEGTQRVEWLAYLAHAALVREGRAPALKRRQGDTRDEFELFVEQCDDLVVEPRTPPAATNASEEESPPGEA